MHEYYRGDLRKSIIMEISSAGKWTPMYVEIQTECS